MCAPQRLVVGRDAFRYVARRAATVLALLLWSVSSHASALITGGEGNEPIRDPGWPEGAAAVFNSPARVAWWEGPPFGGGQWHAEARGDAKVFNVVLEDFAKIKGPKPRLVVHDGHGRSFWLNMNDEPAKREAVKTDWTFHVWQPERFEWFKTLPADLRPSEITPDAKPVPQIDVYVGGNIRWQDVKIPEGIEVDDQRLEAHGFSLADGNVLEGKITDLTTGKPLAATVRLERIERQPKGYRYETVRTIESDDAGHWVLKSAPAGWHRIIYEANGYVSRVVTTLTLDDQPRWRFYESGLARPASVSGRVTDADGAPLADVSLRFYNVTAAPGGAYQISEEAETLTDSQGEFRFEQLPKGTATVQPRKPGYVRPGLGLEIETPSDEIRLEMIKSGRLAIKVDFSKSTRPAGYIVEVKPPGGERVGDWGGSANIDAAGEFTFEHIPPGQYVVTGRPNPGSTNDTTSPVAVEIGGGETVELTIQAK